MKKNWFITGASTGLGNEMTKQLLERGDHVVATVRREGVLADLQAAHGERLVVQRLDVTDTPRVRECVRTAFEQMGRIDVVVSNAGYGLFGAAEEVTDAAIERQIATNLVGSIQVIRAALPLLRGQGGGRIVQLSSVGGQMTFPSFSLYHATKWGIEGFVETVAQEVAPFGIDFVIAEPGATATRFGTGLDLADRLPEYADTPAGQLRRALLDGTWVELADPVTTVSALIAAVDLEKPPLRLPLGSAAFESLTQGVAARAEGLRASEVLSRAADASA